MQKSLFKNYRLWLFLWKHFSPYAMYSYKSNQFVAEAVVKDGEAIFTLGSAKLDDSPDTGDYIHPKWFLIAGFGAIGTVLLLWRKRKSNRT